MTDEARNARRPDASGDDRREFLTKASRVAMTAGLVGGYGGFAAVAGRYLYPARPGESTWQFVTAADQVGEGASLLFRGPSGETINIARQGRAADGTDFIALSSTCPHLGCQVRWEPQNDRFFCPCHNGTFDPSGKATGGPPGEAGQSLPRYPLKVENGLLFIEVPTPRLAEGDARGEIVERTDEVSGPGHDPCLALRPAPSDGRKQG